MRIGENIRGRGFSGLSSIYLGGRRCWLMLGDLEEEARGDERERRTVSQKRVFSMKTNMCLLLLLLSR